MGRSACLTADASRSEGVFEPSGVLRAPIVMTAWRWVALGGGIVVLGRYALPGDAPGSSFVTVENRLARSVTVRIGDGAEGTVPSGIAKRLDVLPVEGGCRLNLAGE